MSLQSEIVYPSIIFKLNGGLYAVGSKHVTAIVQLPAYQTVPDVPPAFIGIFTHRGQVVPLLGARVLFGMRSLKDEFEIFTNMLEQRKHDHIHWVAELERATAAKEPFTLATDPHKCAFGQWFYSYKPTNHAIAFQLAKIEGPHALLHGAAHDLTECEQNCATCSRDECLKKKFQRIKEEYMPTIIHLLNETKEAFRASFHEMAIVLEDGGQSVGLVVDEVLAVEVLSDTAADGVLNLFHQQQYIAAVQKSDKQDGLVLLLDDEKLLGLTTKVNI